MRIRIISAEQILEQITWKNSEVDIKFNDIDIRHLFIVIDMQLSKSHKSELLPGRMHLDLIYSIAQYKLTKS